jgi:demethoxyubiquinone hydroxylase (CLK1/Coq7/Cat5 family)
MKYIFYILKLESQLSTYRQRYSQIDKEKQNLQQLLQEEINHRNNVDSKLRQAEVRKKFSPLNLLFIYSFISARY